MNKSIAIFSLLLLVIVSKSFAQKNINAFKYIIVPNQFEFQKSPDLYQLNSLTKFLFNRAGYSVILEGESFPQDLAKNRCMGLKVKVNDHKGFLTTKLNIDLVDCYNTIVYSTKTGVSREKEFKRAYQEALRNTFTELEDLNYVYDSSLSEPTKPEENREVVEQKHQVLKETTGEIVAPPQKVDEPSEEVQQFRR